MDWSCVLEIELMYSENFSSALSFKGLKGQTMTR